VAIVGCAEDAEGARVSDVSTYQLDLSQVIKRAYESAVYCAFARLRPIREVIADDYTKSDAKARDYLALLPPRET
jgi:hypothetical protein